MSAVESHECQVCGRAWTRKRTGGTRPKTCPECRRPGAGGLRRRDRYERRVCASPACAAEFEGPGEGWEDGRAYCGPECRRIARRGFFLPSREEFEFATRGETRTCETCGEEFCTTRGALTCGGACREVRASRRRSIQAKEIARAAKSQPCADCGGSFPHYVMDFDHVRGEKVANVSALVARGRTAKVIEEIEKCEVVCSNCHRERTWNRAGWE